MANEITLVNGVTKYELQGSGNYKYLFPLAIFDVFPNADPNLGYYNHFDLNGRQILKVEFQQLTDTLGATNIVGYVDALATAGYFFAVGQSGGVVPPSGVLDNRVIVKTEADFGVIDSTKEYFLDGFITVTGAGVNIPNGVKFNVRSYNFNLGGITNIDINGKCVSGGSVGDILATDCSFSATDGIGLDVVSDTGNEAIEFNRVNFNGCSQAAMVIDNFRQLLIDGCGFFGGTPNIEFRGLMNGARITTTIIRGISNSTVFFKAGAGFEMTGSFLTDLNIDLNATGVLCDFTESNFTDVDIIPNVLKFKGARVFRNGITNSDSTSAIPNISESSLASFWSENEGLNNTLIGGRVTITTEVETVITTIDTYVNLLGTFTGEEEVHMESTAAGTLKNLDGEQKEYLLFTGGKLESNQDDMLKIAIFAFRDATSTEELIREETVTVDRLQGARDVADANIITRGILRANDYFFMKVKNLSSTGNITGELSVFMLAVKI